jgi:hypothetical protein
VVNKVGRTHGYPKLVSDWAADMVATAFRELTRV